MVVEIAFRKMAGVMAAEYGRNQFFSGGFTIRAANRNDWNFEMPTVECGELL
jgi:hypothetical protein